MNSAEQCRSCPKYVLTKLVDGDGIAVLENITQYLTSHSKPLDDFRKTSIWLESHHDFLQ